MKKISLLLFSVLCLTAIDKSMAQQVKKAATDTTKQKLAKADTAKQVIRTAANLKSGTSQDVLASFFKLAYQNLNDGHHFQFNSSLFAIKAKTDTSLWIDTNYKNYKFLRNMVIGTDIGLDTANKFKSASFSVKYAILNNRDKSIFAFGSGGRVLDSYLHTANVLNARAITVYHNEHPAAKDYDNAVNYLYPDIHHPRPKQTDVPKRFTAIVDSLKKDKQFEVLKNFKTLNILDSLKDRYNVISGLMSQTSLWTIGSQVTMNQQNIFSKVNFNSEYLKGITNNEGSSGLELDIKGNVDIYDTTAVGKSYSRSVLSSSAGVNWIIYKDKTSQKSYVEFKPALAYNNILSGGLPGEEKSKFTADGVLRFRITDSLWIPFDIKYDPKVGKVFGFINITSNFDWLGGKSKATAN